MQTHRWLALLALSSVLASACRDQEPTGVTARSEAVSSQLTSPPGSGEVHDVTIGRFDVQVRIEGALRPNSPVQISATTRAKLPTADAEVSLAMPEVVAARQSGWDQRYRTPTNTPLPALERRRTGLAAGAEVRLQTAVQVAAPGYYRVVASAVPLSEVPPVVKGAWVQNVAHREVWLWIDEAGGRITEEFEPGLFPDTLLAQPGPFRVVRRGVKRPASAASQSPAGGASFSVSASSASATSLPVEVKYYRTDVDPKRYEPIPRATGTLYYEYFDHNGNYQVLTVQQETGSDGKFYMDCSVVDLAAFGKVGVTAEAALRNGDVIVGTIGLGYASNTYEQDLAWACSLGLSYQIELESKHSHVFMNMNATIPESRRIFEHSRGRMQVVLDSDPARKTSSYRPTEDIIYIKSSDTESRVWGIRGVFSQAHEYGHALHEKALGGLGSFEPCPEGGHYLDGAHYLGCGFREGFANFHATVTRNVYVDLFEGRKHYPGARYYDTDGNEHNGSIIEGAVASFLYDIWDPANEGHDGVQYPGRYIADLIRTCEVNESGWKRRNGIDHLVYCMENTVDPAVTGHSYWFITRSSDPTEQRNSAPLPGGWNPSDIRKAWVYNLHEFPPKTGSGGLKQPCQDGDTGVDLCTSS
jgi:hypothetical protein